MEGAGTEADTADGDARIVAAVLAGDDGASNELFARHAPMVFRVARRVSGDAALAEDLVQDVFVRVFECLPNFRGDSRFTTWLYRVAVTTCLNGVRRPRRIRRVEVSIEDRTLSRGAEREPLVLRMALSKAIDDLPPSLRLPLVLFALEGLSHREVAGALGISEGASRRRVSEARALLRSALDLDPREGGSDGQ